MRRQRKRAARQTGPRISKVDCPTPVITDEIAEETAKKAKKAILDDEDPVRSELISRLNDAVERWKEQKGMPEEKKEGTFSKVLKKITKKGKKDKKAYEEAQNFLKKISNFNPDEVEKINLDDIKPKKEHEKLRHHPKSIDGVKLEVEVKDKPKEPEERHEIDLTKKKDKKKKTKAKHEKISRYKKEIEEAIKAHHKPKKEVFEKKSLHIEVTEGEISALETKERISAAPEKKVFEKKEKIPAKKKIEFDKLKKTFDEKTSGMAKGIKTTLNSLKDHVMKQTKKSLNKTKEFLKEKKEKIHTKRRKEEENKRKKKIKKKKEEDMKEEIEKIYKEIEQI